MQCSSIQQVNQSPCFSQRGSGKPQIRSGHCHTEALPSSSMKIPPPPRHSTSSSTFPLPSPSPPYPLPPFCALQQEEVIALFLVFNKIWKAFKCLTKWLETRKQKDVLASCDVCMKSIDTNTLNAHTVKQDYKESTN